MTVEPTAATAAGLPDDPTAIEGLDSSHPTILQLATDLGNARDFLQEGTAQNLVSALTLASLVPGVGERGARVDAAFDACRVTSQILHIGGIAEPEARLRVVGRAFAAVVMAAHSENDPLAYLQLNRQAARNLRRSTERVAADAQRIPLALARALQDDLLPSRRAATA